MEQTRCRWADPASELYTAYHDQEWGRPEHNDQKLYEMWPDTARRKRRR